MWRVWGISTAVAAIQWIRSCPRRWISIAAILSCPSARLFQSRPELLCTTAVFWWVLRPWGQLLSTTGLWVTRIRPRIDLSVATDIPASATLFPAARIGDEELPVPRFRVPLASWEQLYPRWKQNPPLLSGEPSMVTTMPQDQSQLGTRATRALSSVWVIIPVFNEEESLPLVLRDLPSVGQVIVVDNGSKDRSRAVALQHGAVVVQEMQRGYGSACLAGMTAIRSRALADQVPDVVVFLDGDYSDHPDQLPELVEPILAGEADFVVGSRMRGEREPGAMLPQALFGNRLACFLMWLFWGARFTDLGPFRAISWESLQRLGMCDRNFGWTVEMQIKATIEKLRIREIPVRYRRRIGTSKISGTISGTIKAGYKILYTIARYRWLTWFGR